MAVIRNLVVKVGADISGLSKGLKSAQAKIKQISGSLTKIGGKLTTSVTLPLLAIAGTASKVSADFEQAMANAASVSGATGDELERMTELAREMGATTVFSASQAADAMYFMASAGYKVGQMADSIQPILNLASATQNDLAFTTDTVIATLNQFGLQSSDAERVTNVFASAIGNSQATLEKLQTSMKYLGPVANSMGWSVEQATGALAIMYNAGYDGSMAGTALRQGLTALMNPTAKAKKIFEELGINLEDLNPTTNDLSDIINLLKSSGLDTAQAMQVFGARAGPGMMALIAQGGNAIADMTDKITGTTAASDMATKQLDTMTGQSKLLKSQMEELSLQLGEVLIPIIRNLLKKYVTPFVTKLGSLNKASMETIVKIAAIAVAVGPLLLVIGKLIGFIGTLTKILPLLQAKGMLLWGVIGLIVYVVARALVENEEFRKSIINLLKAVGTLITTALKPFLIIVNAIIPSLSKIAIGVAKFIKWVVEAVVAVIDWLDKTKLLDFALFLLGITLAVIAVGKIIAFIASIWQAVIAVYAFVVATGTTAVNAVARFVVVLLTNAMFALGSFKLALASVCIGLVAMAAAIGLAFYVFTNWDTMNGVQRVIAVIGVLTVALLGAALAFGMFHSAWSLGLAVAGIIAGIVAVVATVESAKSKMPKDTNFDTNSMANNFNSNIGGYAKGGAPPNSSLFYANEFGQPELVANFGGGTGVANNDMIVQAIEDAAYKGMSRAISQMPQSNGNNTAIIEINGREFARATFSDIKAEGKRRGDW